MNGGRMVVIENALRRRFAKILLSEVFAVALSDLMAVRAYCTIENDTTGKYITLRVMLRVPPRMSYLKLKGVK